MLEHFSSAYSRGYISGYGNWFLMATFTRITFLWLTAEKCPKIPRTISSSSIGTAKEPGSKILDFGPSCTQAGTIMQRKLNKAAVMFVHCRELREQTLAKRHTTMIKIAKTNKNRSIYKQTRTYIHTENDIRLCIFYILTIHMGWPILNIRAENSENDLKRSLSTVK